jgi:3-oxoadipate enol-lactonase
MTPVDLHHVIDGPAGGPVLLLGSSLGTTTAMWDPQLPALAENLRVIRYDHRGHGGSPAPPGPYEVSDLGRDALALLDRLGVERASLGGVSMGGMVAMWLGAHAPERVDRLVLCCTSAHMPDAPWGDRAAAVRSAGTTETIADAVVERWTTPGYAKAHPEVRAWLRAMLVSVDAQGYAACCEALERMDIRGDFERITAPTLVISAEEDPATPPEHQKAIAEGIPGARLESLADAAHMAGVERPGAVNRLILDHLRVAQASA